MSGSKTKVMTVVGTRPEIIRISSVIKKLSQHLNHILVHTGQNYDYELNEVFFKDLGLAAPNYFLSSAGASPAETIGNVISKIDPILEKERPDALLILGDTNSCLAAISAKRRKIPIFHMEAGNRCFDFRVPEEINRRIVDHVSDINLPYSTLARDYLIREGIPADRIIKTGSPMKEVLSAHRQGIESSRVLSQLGLEKGKYFLVSAHREENVDSESNFKLLCQSLNQVAEAYGLPVIVSTHPRTQKRLTAQGTSFRDEIRFLKPFGFLDYVHLQMQAKAVLSDSGTISEESSILNFRALNLRETHERPEAMEETPLIMSGLKPEKILEGLRILESTNPSQFRMVEDYNVDNVSDKVLRIILSYIPYVNRVIWSK